MKVRKNKSKGQSQIPEPEKFHEINCPGCGKFIKKIKRQKKTVKESYECPSCTSRFSLTFPGTKMDEDKAAWLRGEGDEFTDFKLKPR